MATVLTFILKAEERVQQDDPSLPGQTEQVRLCAQFEFVFRGFRVCGSGAAQIIFYDPVRPRAQIEPVPVNLYLSFL